MENKEEMNEQITPIVDTNPILDDSDYRITGDDYFTTIAGGAIVLGVSLSAGIEAVKKYLKEANEFNIVHGKEIVRVYPPNGFIIPLEWKDEICN